MSENCFAATATGHVTTITFERPPSNFVTPAVLSELADLLERLDEEAACRAVLLRAAGKVFCAGADLSDAAENGPEGTEATAPASSSPLYAQAVRLHATRKPIVVAVQGAAIGAGLGLALIGDFRVAAPEARFGATSVKLGVHPGFGLTHTLPRLVGPQKAAHLLLTGRRLYAAEALDIGLADQLSTRERLDEDALALATEIAGDVAVAVQSTRMTLRRDLAEQTRAQTGREWGEQQKHFRTRDFAEGVKAMAERRPPLLQGR